MKEIKRDIYLNRLIRRRENGLIKVITGIPEEAVNLTFWIRYFEIICCQRVSGKIIL